MTAAGGSCGTELHAAAARRFEFSPREALFYNDHPDVIIEDFDRSDYGAVLREIERHVIECERRQTPEQAEWVAQGRRRNHRSTGVAATAIVNALQQRDRREGHYRRGSIRRRGTWRREAREPSRRWHR